MSAKFIEKWHNHAEFGEQTKQTFVSMMKEYFLTYDYKELHMYALNLIFSDQSMTFLVT